MPGRRRRCASASTPTTQHHRAHDPRRPTRSHDAGIGDWSAVFAQRRRRSARACARSRSPSQAAAGPPGCSRHDTENDPAADVQAARRRFRRLDTIDAHAKETRAVLLPSAGARSAMPRTAAKCSASGATASPTSWCYRPTGSTTADPEAAARRRSRMDGRLRRRASQTAWRSTSRRRRSNRSRSIGRSAAVRPRDRHARAPGRRRLRMDPQCRRQRGCVLAYAPRRTPRFAAAWVSRHSARRPTTPRRSRPATARASERAATGARARQRARRPGRAAAVDLGARHRVRRASRRQHREPAPHGPAHRPPHDERAVARHLRRLPDVDVEPATSTEGPARSLDATTRCGATRVVRAARRPAAAAAGRQAALWHPARSPADRFVDPGGSTAETGSAKLLDVLRPMLRDREHERAADAGRRCRQAPRTSCRPAAWSQTAYYRDKDAARPCAWCPRRSAKRRHSPHPGGREGAAGAVGSFNSWRRAYLHAAATSFPTRRIRPAISPACPGCWRTRRTRPRRRRTPRTSCRRTTTSRDRGRAAQSPRPEGRSQ